MHQYDVTSLQALESVFGEVGEASVVKELDHIDSNYRAWIEASPFLALATVGRMAWIARPVAIGVA